MNRRQSLIPQSFRLSGCRQQILYAALAWLSVCGALGGVAGAQQAGAQRAGLQRATFQRYKVARASWSQEAHQPAGWSPQRAVLTLVGQIRQLPTDKAGRAIPVQLKGVVTAVSGWRNSFFFEDASGGISVDSDDPTGARAGDEVELTGNTGAGMFAAIVAARQVKVLGRGKLPAAPLFSYTELMGGAEDSDRIAVRGVVRAAKIDSLWEHKILKLVVEGSGGQINMLVHRFAANDAERLVDAIVRVRGVCSSSFNDKRQFTGMALFVTDMGDVTVEEPAPADPYSSTRSLIQEVMRYQPGARFTHRVSVAGTVTYQDVGRSLYLQDGTSGILVETEQRTALPLGSRVEAVGFPALGAYSPILRGAIFRAVRGEGKIVPLPISAKHFIEGETTFVHSPYDSQLVTLRGELLEKIERPHEEVWSLADGSRHFFAILRRGAEVSQPVEIAKGSTVLVTGIFSTDVDEEQQPTSFHILLRGGDGLVVVKQPSWWSSRHTLEVLAAVLVMTFCIGLWGLALRVRVRQQTGMLRKSEQRFREQAQQDTLTGLASRSYLHEQLLEAIGMAREKRLRIGLLMIDLDHFKQVNDTLGHHAGDELLCIVAQRIRDAVRKNDLVARMGGDEFVVLLRDVREPHDAQAVGGKVVASVSAAAEIAGRPMLMSASVGVCVYPENGLDGKTLLQNVDAAMYKAKAAGKNGFAVYEPERAEMPLQKMIAVGG